MNITEEEDFLHRAVRYEARAWSPVTGKIVKAQVLVTKEMLADSVVDIKEFVETKLRGVVDDVLDGERAYEQACEEEDDGQSHT